MKIEFGTKLKLKKDWEVGFIALQRGDVVDVALYSHKYGMKIHHEGLSNLLDFKYDWNNRDTRLNEWFELVESFDDRLAELEKAILDYYLGKGYQVGVGHWGFNVEIESDYKSKQLIVYFCKAKGEHYEQILKIEIETTKEMFDKAIEYFSPRGDK